jgi:hypothetical protein
MILPTSISQLSSWKVLHGYIVARRSSKGVSLITRYTPPNYKRGTIQCHSSVFPNTIIVFAGYSTERAIRASQMLILSLALRLRLKGHAYMIVCTTSLAIKEEAHHLLDIILYRSCLKCYMARLPQHKAAVNNSTKQLAYLHANLSQIAPSLHKRFRYCYS